MLTELGAVQNIVDWCYNTPAPTLGVLFEEKVQVPQTEKNITIGIASRLAVQLLQQFSDSLLVHV